jgi:hypothetical protein
LVLSVGLIINSGVFYCDLLTVYRSSNSRDSDRHT